MTTECRVYLRGGAVLEGVYWSGDAWIRERSKRMGGPREEQFVRLLWDPGHTPLVREAFNVRIDLGEVIAVLEKGE